MPDDISDICDEWGQEIAQRLAEMSDEERSLFLERLAAKPSIPPVSTF